MKRTVLLVALLVPAIFLSAQTQPVGNLTIFSEDGDKFYLILNGEKQNDVPKSNIRIEELPQPYYNAKIVFADSSIAPISKTNLMVANADGTLMDVTYKLRREKGGKAKLNYYSAIAVQQNFIPPAGTYVHHYGRRDHGNDRNGRNDRNDRVTTTTRTTTTTTASNTTNANVSVSADGTGVGMNVTIVDPVGGPMVTEKTTVTTTSSSSGGGGGGRNNHTSSDRSGGCNRAMLAADFTSAKKTITSASFESSKLSTAKTIASSNCLSTAQVMEICGLFDFEDTKLTFAEYAYKYTTDPKSYYKVGTVFTYDSSKDKLNQFLADKN